MRFAGLGVQRIAGLVLGWVGRRDWLAPAPTCEM